MFKGNPDRMFLWNQINITSEEGVGVYKSSPGAYNQANAGGLSLIALGIVRLPCNEEIKIVLIHYTRRCPV